MSFAWTNAAARSMHRTQWAGGRHKLDDPRHYHWPFEGKGEMGFAEVCVKARFIDALPTSLERAERYKAVLLEKGSMGPSWGYLRRRRNPGRVYLADGNHRAYAAIELGWKCVPVIVPMEDVADLRRLGALA